MISACGSAGVARLIQMRRLLLLAPGAAWVIFAAAGLSHAQTVTLSDDAEYARAIKAATTEPRFLTPWVDSLPAHVSVPNPRQHLGYIVGAPGKVSDVEQIHGYFRKLAATSARAKLFSFGLSDEGREALVLAIADEAVLERLGHYKSQLKALADPRRTTLDAAQAIIAQAKPVYWVHAGLHSEELGPPEMSMELAYRLIVEEREPFASIRRNIITLITPVLEVDGRARQAEWTRQHALGHTNEWDHPPFSPPYWGKYVHHDNNRDAILVTQKLTQNYFDTYFDWLPTLSLDLHESIAYLYVLGGTGPYNEGLDATTTSEWHLLSHYEVTRLTGLGLPGVWTWGYTDQWYPGYLASTGSNHNGSGRVYEIFGNYTPETLQRDLSEKKYLDQPVTSRQWYRPVPPSRITRWSMRNNTNYAQSGVIASLEVVANNPSFFLRNFYDRGVNAIRKGAQTAPHAFLIPREQRDRGAAKYLIDVLRRQRIELTLAFGAASAGAVRAGDILVKLDQPYGPLARNLLERQKFPVIPAAPAPYDDVAWTLGLMLGVTVQPVDDPGVLSWPGRPLGADEDIFASFRRDVTSQPATHESAARSAASTVWAVPHRGQANTGPFRFALGPAKVYAAERPFEAGGVTLPAGSLLIRARDFDAARLRRLLEDHKLDAVALNEFPAVATHELDLPRVGILQSWLTTQQAGWVRFAFDQSAIPYSLLGQERLRRGGLRRDFDVLLVPGLGPRITAQEIIRGIDTKWGKLAYQKTAQTPSLGAVSSSADISGGFGFEGMAALREFVAAGGTLVTLDSAGVLVGETGLSRKISVDRPAGMNTPGSITTAMVLNRASPLLYGYDDITYVFHGNGPLYQVPSHARSAVALQFGTKVPDSGATEPKTDIPLILSGGIVAGADVLDGAPALIVESVGKGRMVVFGWNPMHRHMNQHDHAMLYNAILNWNDLP